MQPTILNIALDVPLNRTFDYLSGGFVARIGSRVIVPFAGRNLVGVVLQVKHTSDYPIEKLKPVSHVFDDSVFDTPSFNLLKFCADYYHYPLGQALISALPLRLRQLKPAITRKQLAYQLVQTADACQTLAQIPAKKVLLHRIIAALQASPVLAAADAALISASWKKAMIELKGIGLVTEHEVLAVKASMPSSVVEPDFNIE
ncbi:MAG TPA: primosomal protein N', partial [Methylotenera sp.]|nr:primosomal protein N' [Methylotenera sp.]